MKSTELNLILKTSIDPYHVVPIFVPDRRSKVRQAVLDAKEELQRDQQQAQSRAEGATRSGSSAGQGDGSGDDAGVGLSGLFSLVRNPPCKGMFLSMSKGRYLA